MTHVLATDNPVDIEFGEFDRFLFAEGSHFDLHRKLGAHPVERAGARGVQFAVWAPNASCVSVVGDFNGWRASQDRMSPVAESGVWTGFVANAAPGDRYKFEIRARNGVALPWKIDPFARGQEAPPRSASVIQPPDTYHWNDQNWMARRAGDDPRSKPISIYEVHLGSWARSADGGFLSYDELAERLIPYAVQMGFTHIELMPLAEHPFYGSWGYQPVALFAPTGRYGPPDGLRRLIDRAHQAELGVILDWVVGHFPDDEHGLAQFDGTSLYEHQDWRQGRHREWNTLIYNYGRREVGAFLISNAVYWLEEFHIDGLRADAVASMLYLDYGKTDDDWIRNIHGGHENLEAVSFLKRLNEAVYDRCPGAFTVAEESTSWPQVSRPTYLGGLGFGFKWNMGWMNDTLRYIGKDPVHRKYHHADLTFGMLYAYHENFILPLSHDEVVHGKGSLIGKMPGDRWRKFANLRAYLAFLFTHPGKKLLFMGGEFGQWREWNHESGLDWDLLNVAEHRGVQSLVVDLNRLYGELPALHRRDCDAGGFQWIEPNDSDNNVLAYIRRGDDPEDDVVVVCNFSPVVRHDYQIGVPHEGEYRELVNTDSHYYCGTNVGNYGAVRTAHGPTHGWMYSLSLVLPPLATLVLARR